VTIDDASGLPACPPYAGKHVHEEIYEFWPSDLEQVFAEAGIPRRKPPQNRSCADAGAPEGAAPQITSPLRGSAYALRLTEFDRRRIAFNATADADARTLYWFMWAAARRVNRFSGSRRRRAPTASGPWTIAVAATSGRSMSRSSNSA
jgi:penicillin-binding protein 1C